MKDQVLVLADTSNQTPASQHVLIYMKPADQRFCFVSHLLTILSVAMKTSGGWGGVLCEQPGRRRHFRFGLDAMPHDHHVSFFFHLVTVFRFFVPSRIPKVQTSQHTPRVWWWVERLMAPTRSIDYSERGKGEI